MPALSYYNGQVVTPPEYPASYYAAGPMCAPLPPPPPPPPVAPPPAYQYGGYGAAAPPPPPPPPPPGFMTKDYNHQHHAAAAGMYRRQPSRSQLFETHPHASYSSNGTTFYLAPPQVPLDQAAPSYNHHHNALNNNNSEVTGGVSAKLDYNFDNMASFLSSMASSIMQKTNGVAEFEKFCLQVLQSTRLPKATVILALVYLSKRWALGQLPNKSLDSMAEYKMLVVALLLANKFHDDNTFTNKSWKEATGLPVADLTRLERQWLEMIGWSVHLKTEDELNGWKKWNQCWNVFVEKGGRYVANYSPIGSPVQYESSYTIPKWYETANSRPLPHQQQQQVSPSNFTFFQQSSYNGLPAPVAQQPPPPPPPPPPPVAPAQPQQSFYVSAYNNMETCNCSMCSFEPAAKHYTHHHQTLPPLQQVQQHQQPQRMMAPINRPPAHAAPIMPWYGMGVNSVAAC